MLRFKKEKGVSLYLLIIAMMIILGIVLSLSLLILIRFKSVRGLGDSVVSFYLADSGVEQQLYELKERAGRGSISRDFSSWSQLDNASLEVSTRCRPEYTKCSELCPGGNGSEKCMSPEPDKPNYCSAPRFCIRSSGSFSGTKRAIKVEY